MGDTRVSSNTIPGVSSEPRSRAARYGSARSLPLAIAALLVICSPTSDQSTAPRLNPGAAGGHDAGSSSPHLIIVEVMADPARSENAVRP